MISGVNKMKSIIFRPCSDLFNPNQLLNLSIIDRVYLSYLFESN